MRLTKASWQKRRHPSRFAVQKRDLKSATSSLGIQTYFESKPLARFCCEFLNLQHLAESAFGKSVHPNEAPSRQVPHPTDMGPDRRLTECWPTVSRTAQAWVPSWLRASRMARPPPAAAPGQPRIAPIFSEILKDYESMMHSAMWVPAMCRKAFPLGGKAVGVGALCGTAESPH
jgi:hypothetical protein